ncbi:uncharacterized protein E0L32_007336 [Thyridium curvatum]|uniref:Uncharacterized protein n=1 Tax=Thyridium curvatum TaxID=1093900 RepID=A0A507AWC9_9PEZI|nr:uncharacterized protein E0L32_007336 [Thyridium curvatum]TPX12033.1 hypothetical protein E0L32_007336 [Thyridium curvatum]
MAHFKTLSDYDLRIYPDSIVSAWGSPPVPLSYISSNVAKLYDRPAEVDLLSSSCLYPNTPGFYPRLVPNCTAVCADPAYLFANSRNLWSCATLAAVARLVEDGGSDAITLDRSSVQAANTAFKLGYGDSRNQTFGFDTGSTLKAIGACARASCEVSGGLVCSVELKESINGTSASGPNAVRSLRDTLGSYCNNASEDSSADVAGPGIAISIIIQTILSLVLFVLIKISTSWLRFAVYPFMTKKSSVPPAESTLPQGLWETATMVQGAVKGSRPATALLSAAFDFHEIQLYFAIAIQTAALLANNNLETSQSGAAGSYAALMVTMDRVTNLAMNAFLPCLLVELLLRRACTRHRSGARRPSPHSWWTLLLVTVSWGLGCAVMATQPQLDFDDLARQFRARRPLAACGGNPSLALYCGLDRGLAGASDFAPLLYAVGVGYPVVPALWVQQVAWAVACRGKSDEAVRRAGFYGLGIAGKIGGGQTPPASRSAGRTVWIWIVEVVWALLQGATVVFTCFYVKGLADVVQRVGLGAAQWTFGQVVAVMVWAPFIARLVYLQLFGVKKGFAVRLPEEYQVVRRQKEAVLQEGEDSPFADPANMEPQERAEWPRAAK